MPKSKQFSIPGFIEDGEFRKTYNIVLRRGDDVRRLAAFTMIPDGSVILFNQAPHANKQYSANRIPARKGKMTLKLKDMKVIDDDPNAVPGKLTFHATGVINFDNTRRGVRSSLKTMDLTQPLATFIHPHFAELSPLARDLKSTDIVFWYNDWPDDARPMIKAFISPPKDNIIEKYVDESINGFIDFTYKGESIRHSAKHLHVQFILSSLTFDSDRPTGSLQIVIMDNDQLVPEALRPTHSKV